MANKEGNIEFIRFLNDEKFIEWRLFQSDESEEYWKNYLRRHPEETENVEMAKKRFRNIKLSNYSLSQKKKIDAGKRLETALHKHRQRKKTEKLVYIAAACVAALILSLIFVQNHQTRHNAISSKNCIVGNALQSKDIQLVTTDKVATFEENIDIEINENGVAAIKTEKNTQASIAIADRKLNKLIVPYGKRSKIILSDQTKVWLNSGSVLEFPAHFSKNKREIFLHSGEMYLEVATDSNRPFYVQTSNFNVKVYGTKFNVSAYDNAPQSVVLVEGSVGLKSKDKEEILLSPNEQAIYCKDQAFRTQKVDVSQSVSWKNGYLLLNATPMTEVLKQIERYYNLSFNYNEEANIKKRTCTGKIFLSENLDNVMKTIAILSDTKYIRDNNKIYITNHPHNKSKCL